MRISSFLITLFAVLFCCATPAFAEAGAPIEGLTAVSAAICIGFAAFGGALAQGKTASSALDGIARNPGASGQMFVPMLLGLVLIESLVIYALIVALKLSGII